MTKTLKPRRTSKPEEIQTDITPQALPHKWGYVWTNQKRNRH